MPNIKEDELKKALKSGDIANLWFLYGEEKYLLSFYRDKLVSSVVKDVNNSFNFQKFSGDAIDINQVSEAIEAFPLMVGKKCVLVEDLNIDLLNENQLKNILSIISDIPDYCILIFSMPTIDIPAKKSSKFNKVIKECEKFGNVVNFEKRGSVTLEKQLISWSKKQGVTLSTANAGRIIKYCGDDLQTLRNELEKLCAYVLDGEITEEIIEKLVTKNLETTVFVLSNAVATGDYNKAYKQLDILLYQKEEPIAILAILASVYIDMYRVRLFIENGKEPTDLKNYFDYKGKEFKIRNAVKNSRNLPLESLREAIDLLLKADIELKSSKIDKRLIMEETITKLFLLYKKGRNC